MSGANEVVDQPMPTHNNSRPLWEMVIEGTLQAADILQRQTGDGWAQNQSEVLRKVAEDMKGRHEVGVARYGTALQPNNGRNALVDAYQEILDFIVYLKQVLVENKLDRVSLGIIARKYDFAIKHAADIKACLLAQEGKL